MGDNHGSFGGPPYFEDEDPNGTEDYPYVPPYLDGTDVSDDDSYVTDDGQPIGEEAYEPRERDDTDPHPLRWKEPRYGPSPGLTPPQGLLTPPPGSAAAPFQAPGYGPGSPGGRSFPSPPGGSWPSKSADPDTTILPVTERPGGGNGPPAGFSSPAGGRGGQRQPRRRGPRGLLLFLALVVLAVLAFGVYAVNPMNIMGRNTAVSHPHATNSAATPVRTRPPGAESQSASSGGVATPNASTSPSASASRSASAPAGFPGPSATSTLGTQGGTVCLDTTSWNTDPQARSGNLQRPPLIVRSNPGIHGNCDRLVLVLRGSFKPGAKVGFDVRYVKRVTTDPKGSPVDLEGHPALRLVVHASSQLAVHGGYVVSPSQLRQLASKVNGAFKELRWVKSAGSFEGQTQLVISVNHKHPFAALTIVDPQGNLLLILDVAALAHGNMPSPAPSSWPSS